MAMLVAARPAAVSIVESLFGSEIEHIRESEGLMCKTALLMTGIFLGKGGKSTGVCNALEKGLFKEFDANPGDGGCQLRALALRDISNRDLSKECAELKAAMEKIKRVITSRYTSHKLPEESSSVFFDRELRVIQLSAEMEYLMHCHLLKVLRTPYQTLASGVVMTKTEMHKLTLFQPAADKIESDIRRAIVEESQVRTSFLSMERVRAEVDKITTLLPAELEIVTEMLSESHTHVFTADDRFRPKAFGCLFYAIKTLLQRLKEEQTLICLKGIVPKGREGVSLFLQSSARGAEFALIPGGAVIDTAQDVVVFEVVFNQTEAATREMLSARSFTEEALINASLENQFERGSTLESMEHESAIEEVLTHKAMAEGREIAFAIDHIYFDKLKHVRLS
ncbi:MAG: hypothetical protein NTX49_04680 [Chlamydiae bacterium]|nr:hypothetical protein [Chlamydiota bacterium]